MISLCDYVDSKGNTRYEGRSYNSLNISGEDVDKFYDFMFQTEKLTEIAEFDCSDIVAEVKAEYK
jgi:hypothetical protein